MWKIVKDYFSKFRVLRHTSKEFWILNLVINFLGMLASWCFLMVLTLYLTYNIGFDDEWTGMWVGYFMTIMTAMAFLAGPLIDSIGIKKVMAIGMAILITISSPILVVLLKNVTRPDFSKQVHSQSVL